MWQGKEIAKLLDIELIQAYATCVAQEERREVASRHKKFNQDDIEHKKPKMEFPPVNPYFLQVKAELLNEINNRNIKLEI